MIWRCFISDKLRPIVFIDGTVNQDTYIGILMQHFLPFLDALRSDDNTTPLYFVQDNAISHRAIKMWKWFKSIVEMYNMVIIDWLPNSPDLNIIQQLWIYFKRKLCSQFSDTSSLTGLLIVIKSKIHGRLHTIWWDIRASILYALIESMSSRVAAGVYAGGWYMEFWIVEYCALIISSDRFNVTELFHLMVV